jgi:hypothetical protein
VRRVADVAGLPHFPCKRLRIARKVGLQIPRRLGKKKSEAVPGSGRRCVAWRTSPDYIISLQKAANSKESGSANPKALGKKKSEAVPGSGRRCVAWRTSPDYLIFLANGCE